MPVPRFRAIRLRPDENEDLINAFNQYLYKKQEKETRVSRGETRDYDISNQSPFSWNNSVSKGTQTLYRSNTFSGSRGFRGDSKRFNGFQPIPGHFTPCCWAGSSEILETCTPPPPPPPSPPTVSYECFCAMEKTTEDNLRCQISHTKTWIDIPEKETDQRKSPPLSPIKKKADEENDDYRCQCPKKEPFVYIAMTDYRKGNYDDDDDQQLIVGESKSGKSKGGRGKSGDFGGGGGGNFVTSGLGGGGGGTTCPLSGFSVGCGGGGGGGGGGGMSNCTCGNGGGAWPEKGYGPPQGANADGCYCRCNGSVSGAPGGPCFCDATFIPYVEKRCKCVKKPEPEPYYPIDGRTVYSLSYMQNVELVREKKQICQPVCCYPMMACYPANTFYPTSGGKGGSCCCGGK